MYKIERRKRHNKTQFTVTYNGIPKMMSKNYEKCVDYIMNTNSNG